MIVSPSPKSPDNELYCHPDEYFNSLRVYLFDSVIIGILDRQLKKLSGQVCHINFIHRRPDGCFNSLRAAPLGNAPWLIHLLLDQFIV